MSHTNTHRHAHFPLITTFLSSFTHSVFPWFLLFSLFLSFSLLFSKFFPLCCECLTGSCWQGCDETKGPSVEAGLSSLAPPPLPPSGPEAPCPVVQYFYFLSPFWAVFYSNTLFPFISLKLWYACSGGHQSIIHVGLTHRHSEATVCFNSLFPQMEGYTNKKGNHNFHNLAWHCFFKL